MRIVFIGTVEFSKKMLEKLISLKADVVGVLTKRKSAFNSDFVDLYETCRRYDIPCRYAADINSVGNVEWIRKLKPDIIFCFGWSQLLKGDILNIAPMGIVGFHPTKLPQNRGRHPVIWALVLGLGRTASSLFLIDKNIDSGDIISQKEIEITYEDDACSLSDKITKMALWQIEELLPKLNNRTFDRVPQDDALASYWRKRNKDDGKIDFEKDSRSAYNLVRALTRPYVGAHVVYKDKEIKIWKAKESEGEYKDRKTGEVLNVFDNKIVVKCAKNAIIFLEHEFKDMPKIGEHLV